MKYLIIPLLILLMLWPVGDVNFDGKLNSADLNQVYVGNLNPIQLIIADVNHDFKVDKFDLDILFQMVLRGR